MATDQPEKLVGALVGGLRVLRYLSAAPSGVGVTRVARDLQLNSSTCYNFLKTLVHEGLVSFDDETKTYSIALGLVELAKGALEQGSYVRLIHPQLIEIARDHASPPRCGSAPAMSGWCWWTAPTSTVRCGCT